MKHTVRTTRLTGALTAMAWGLGAGISMWAMAAPNMAVPDDRRSSGGTDSAVVADLSAGSQASAAKAHAKANLDKSPLDRSGKKQVGVASFYKTSYAGKTMADGTPMQLYGDNAASTTLPLGTKARVTNLETGRSALITIRDRGPYVKGRIVDLSPGTAEKIGLDRKRGLARVEVIPLTIPPAGWRSRAGRGAA